MQVETASYQVGTVKELRLKVVDVKNPVTVTALNALPANESRKRQRYNQLEDT